MNQIYRRWSSGVVQITSTSIVNVPQDPLFGNPFASPQQEEQSLGSGFVIDKAGHIVTNYHVIEGAKSVRVSFSNGDNMKALRRWAQIPRPTSPCWRCKPSLAR